MRSTFKFAILAALLGVSAAPVYAANEFVDVRRGDVVISNANGYNRWVVLACHKDALTLSHRVYDGMYQGTHTEQVRVQVGDTVDISDVGFQDATMLKLFFLNGCFGRVWVH